MYRYELMVSPRGMSTKIIAFVSQETVTITFPSSSSGQKVDANPMTFCLRFKVLDHVSSPESQSVTKSFPFQLRNGRVHPKTLVYAEFLKAVLASWKPISTLQRCSSKQDVENETMPKKKKLPLILTLSVESVTQLFG